MRIEKAVYHEAILPEYKGNPFIEALPPKLSGEKLLKAFSHYPDCDEEIRAHPDPLVRQEYVSRIGTLRQPFLLYVDCFRAIEKALKLSYSSRNPLSPTTAQFLHYPVANPPEIKPSTGAYQPKGIGITLVGESGVGKTTMIEQILNYFPTVIRHDTYKGETMQFCDQVIWIKVDCPDHSSVKDLCHSILKSLNACLGRDHEKPKRDISDLLDQIEARIKSSFLGVLVIDEMQRLNFTRTGGENKLLNFLHTLVNQLGVPIFFCANPPFDETLAKTLKSARRAESAGYFRMNVLSSDSLGWRDFVPELWKLQWTDVVTELDDELRNTLHMRSRGNVDLACRIYAEAQMNLIGSGDERITPAVLETASLYACGLSLNTLEMLGIDNEEQDQTDLEELEKEQPPRKKSEIIGDITRSQHPEFTDQLRELQNAVDIHARLKKPDLLRSAYDEEDPIVYLLRVGILCDDPLQHFKS